MQKAKDTRGAPIPPLFFLMPADFYLRSVRWAFDRFYREFAWTYDTVAALVSGGHWHDWALAVRPSLHGRILEIGCGTGSLQRALRASPASSDAVGLDLSRQMLALAQRKLNRAGLTPRLLRADAGTLPFATSVFDTVVATFPSEYVIAPATLAGARRVLRPGGRLVMTTPNQFYLKSRLKTLGDVALVRPFEPFDEFRRAMRLEGPQRYYNHSRLYTMQELRWLTEQAGMRVAAARYVDAWERVGVEARRVLRHPLRVAVKSGLWLLTSAFPTTRSMLMVVGVK